MKEPKAANAVGPGFYRLNQTPRITIAHRLRHAQDLGLVWIGDEVRVERLAMAFNTLKGIQVAFKKVRSCAHFCKHDEIVKRGCHQYLPHEIRFALVLLWFVQPVLDREITHKIGVHALIFEVLKKLSKAA